MHRTTRRIISSLVVLAAFFLILKFLPLKEWLDPVWSYVQAAGGWGYLLFILLGLILSLLMLPISSVIIAGGLLFGFWKGLAMAGAVLLFSTSLGYLVGNMFWPRIEHYPVFQNRWFRAVRKAIEDEGVYLVGLLRMTPFIHFTIGNLFYGSLSLNFWKYLLASLLGMVPGTMLLTYAGHLAEESVNQKVDLGGWQTGLFALGVLIFVGITALVTHRTRRILQKEAGRA